MHQATLRPDLGVRLIHCAAGKPYNRASLMISKPVVNKAQYTETEAAQQLGVSIEEFRVLIRRHIVVDEADSGSFKL